MIRLRHPGAVAVASLAIAFAGVAFADGAAMHRAAVTRRAVTIALLSGTPQSAHAFVAAHASRYEAAFPNELAVRVAGPDGSKIRFACETDGCAFPPSDQGDNVHRIDVRSYYVDSADGRATIKLTVSAPSPRTVVVSARPEAGAASRSVRFVLEMR